jgi:hypothetical protein
MNREHRDEVCYWETDTRDQSTPSSSVSTLISMDTTIPKVKRRRFPLGKPGQLSGMGLAAVP